MTLRKSRWSSVYIPFRVQLTQRANRLAERRWYRSGNYSKSSAVAEERQGGGGKSFCGSACELAYFWEETSSRFMTRACTYIDARRPSPRHCSAPRKDGKGWLSLPPRLVGANEGGTDRPVCTLPLSGSCRASTPRCTLRCVQCNGMSPFFFRTSYYEILPTEKQASFVPDNEKGKKKKRAGLQVHHWGCRAWHQEGWNVYGTSVPRIPCSWRNYFATVVQPSGGWFFV